MEERQKMQTKTHKDLGKTYVAELVYRVKAAMMVINSAETTHQNEPKARADPCVQVLA
jgi:hypothetical protein